MVGAELRAIKTLSQLQHRIVPARLHHLENGACSLLDFRIKQARERGDLAQSLAEIGVGMPQDVHGAAG